MRMISEFDMFVFNSIKAVLFPNMFICGFNVGAYIVLGIVGIVVNEILNNRLKKVKKQ